MKQAKQDVQDALNSIALPAYISKPIISQLNTSMIPIANIAVTFEDGLTEENMDFAREELQSLYQEIKGVSSVDVYGITDSIISVNIDDEKLAENQISLQAVMGILNGQNTAVAIGEKIIDGKTSNIKVIGDLTSIEKLKGFN